MSRSLFVIILVVALDAIGIGLIFPILPSLLEELTGHGEVSTIYGVILAAYATMQFLFAPILGLLSDRIGRRPVYLIGAVGVGVWGFLFVALLDTKNFALAALARSAALHRETGVGRRDGEHRPHRRHHRADQ